MKKYMALVLNTKTYSTEYWFTDTSDGKEKAKEMILNDTKRNGVEGYIISLYEINRLE